LLLLPTALPGQLVFLRSAHLCVSGSVKLQLPSLLAMTVSTTTSRHPWPLTP